MDSKDKRLFFVMYDIVDDRVRRYIVKYLERMGCVRVQKSIFMANLPLHLYDSIRQDLSEVLDVYDNQDSIIVVPLSQENFRASKFIGQNVDLNSIVNDSNTMFF